jgi:hypothetical protein
MMKGLAAWKPRVRRPTRSRMDKCISARNGGWSGDSGYIASSQPLVAQRREGFLIGAAIFDFFF